jgi:ubiquinone/menaquinone biosynthesis C-methylase UbiE
VLALREIGVLDSIGISTNPTASTLLIVDGEALRQPFGDDTFDFEFTGTFGLDRSNRPFDLASEISRTLRPGGFLVVHTATKDRYSLDSLLEFFTNCCRFSI